MNFNHSAETASKALGIEEGFDERINQLVSEIADKGDELKFSEAAEMMHNRLTRAEILLLAACNLQRDIEEMILRQMGMEG